MDEWPVQSPEKNFEKKDLPELNQEFFQKVSEEILETYSTQKEKPTLPRILFHNIMRKNGFDDIALFAKSFQDILDFFKAKNDDDLQEILMRKRKEAMPWLHDKIKDGDLPESALDTNRTYASKGAISQKGMKRMMPGARHHDLANRRPGHPEDDDE